jgi:Outer membrane protein beta-barrel domain
MDQIDPPYTIEQGESQEMKIRTMWLAVAACLLFAVSTRAQGRWEVTPFVGYETSGSYPVTSTSGIVDELRLNGSVAFGGFIDYSLTENFQPEFMWDRNNTNYSAHDILTNSYVNAYHTANDQFQFGGIYMFRSSEVKLRPYVAASLGFTHESNNNNIPNRTEFAFSVGGGVKYYVSRHIGFRGDIRYLPTYGSTSLAVYCDPFFGCYQANVHNYLNRANMVGGIVFKF